jgi:uncharacterized protein YdaU (DUF1376 family)
MHYYPFNLKDYLTETAHLPPMADLAYRRLLDLYYKTEAPIPNKPKWVANRIRMDSEEAIIGFVLREYFTLDGVGPAAFWRNKTCDEVIAKYQKKAAVARENGLKHTVGTKKEPKSDADRKLTNNQKPRTNRNTPLPPEGEVWWDEFWKTYPRKANKPAALRAFAKAITRVPSFEVLMAGLRRHLPCDQWQDATKIPHPATWLNGDQWNDEPVAAPGAGDADRPGAWWNTAKGILDKGMEMGLPGPADASGMPFLRHTAAVWMAAGDGPWIDEKSTAYQFYVRLRNGET